MNRVGKPNRACGGFTLVEVIVCIVLFSSLVIVVSSMYSFVRRTFMRVDGKTAAAAEIERFLLRLDTELRTATDVPVPNAYVKSNSLIFYNQDGNQIGYEFGKDGKVTRTEYQTGKSKVLMTDVEHLQFSRFTPGLVEIVVTSGKVSVMTAVHVWNLQ